MELKRKYVIYSISGKKIADCDDLAKAKKILKNILLNDYEKFIKKTEKENGEFTTYWKWYYTKKENYINGKSYEIKAI